jgi:hypothetical protein
MAVSITGTKKTVLVKFQGCEGHNVACEFGEPGGDLIEKKDVRLHVDSKGFGHANFVVGAGFSGDVHCKFVGSSAGSDEGTVTVP